MSDQHDTSPLPPIALTDANRATLEGYRQAFDHAGIDVTVVAGQNRAVEYLRDRVHMPPEMAERVVDALEQVVTEASTPRAWESHHVDARTGKVTLLATAEIRPGTNPDGLVESVVTIAEGLNRGQTQTYLDQTAKDAAERLSEFQGFRPVVDPAHEVAAGITEAPDVGQLHEVAEGLAALDVADRVTAQFPTAGVAINRPRLPEVERPKPPAAAAPAKKLEPRRGRR